MFTYKLKDQSQINSHLVIQNTHLIDTYLSNWHPDLDDTILDSIPNYHIFVIP